MMQTENLQVTGMTCGGCTSSVTRALMAVHGVNDVNASLSTGQVTVQYDEKFASTEQLKSAVIAAGYGIDAASYAQKPQGKSGCCC